MKVIMIHANPVSVASDLNRDNLKIKSDVYSPSKSLFDSNYICLS